MYAPFSTLSSFFSPNIPGGNLFSGTSSIDNCYRMANHNQLVKLALKRLFSPLDLLCATHVHLITFSRPTTRNSGKYPNRGCAEDRNCAQCQILPSVPKKRIPLTEGFWNGYFQHIPMPLTYHLKFLDLCSVRTRGPGPKGSIHVPFHCGEGVRLRKTMPSVFNSASFKTKIVCERSDIVEFDQELRKKLITVELHGEVWKERKTRTVLKAHKNPLQPLHWKGLSAFISINSILKKEGKKPS